MHRDKQPQDGHGVVGRTRGKGYHRKDPVCNERPTEMRALTKSLETSMQVWVETPSPVGKRSRTMGGRGGMLGARNAEQAARKIRCKEDTWKSGLR